MLGPILNTDRVPIILNPDVVAQKIQRLRELKVYLKNTLTSLQSRFSESESLSLDAQKDILVLYQKRVNELLARAIMEIGEPPRDAEATTFTTEESACFTSSSRSYARYDRFVFGANFHSTNDPNQKGIVSPLTQTLTELANTIEQTTINQPSLSESLRANGIDPQKFEEATFSPEEVRKIAESVLDAYGIKSSEDPESYTPERIGPAEDGGWQVVFTNSSSASVDGTKRVVKIPQTPCDIKRLLTVIVAHEIEGHALQHNNRSQSPLGLLAHIGGDRAELYAEMGAMYNQNYVSESVFGVSSLPGANYARAMASRIEGKNYLECVETFYQSSLKKFPNATENQRSVALKMAINRTLRLFRGQNSLSGGIATSSKDLLYLEQIPVMQALVSRSIPEYGLIAGVTTQTAKILKKWGLLDTKTIQKPKYIALDLWEEIKQNLVD